jgi:FkbM family methyltransferase
MNQPINKIPEINNNPKGFFNKIIGLYYQKKLNEFVPRVLVFITRRLNIAPKFFLNKLEETEIKPLKKYIKTDSAGKTYLDILGAKLPDILDDKAKALALRHVFEDTFFIPLYYKGDFSKKNIDFLDKYLDESTYGYTDGDFDVTVKKGDVVIDAGAWIGDFSAYAVSQGATDYAFEPEQSMFNLLKETAKLNDDKIFPIQKGLGEKEETVIMETDEQSGLSSSVVRVVLHGDSGRQEISITTLDKFAEENNLERLDFIKADIEGAERQMLRGATKVLQKFAPKLALCTYHRPDDPEVLEKIILEANPNYKVVQLSHKLIACVVKK